MKTIELDVFDRNGEFLGKKRFHTKKIERKINDWYSTYYNKNQNFRFLKIPNKTHYMYIHN